MMVNYTVMVYFLLNYGVKKQITHQKAVNYTP